MNISRVVIILIAALLVSITAIAAHAAGTDPIFAGVWSEKEPGAGGMFINQSWDNLVSRWKELGSNQYLADVEAYRHDGQWRYAGLWRVGPGNGALFALGWEDFVRKWKELGGKQDLIDIEVINTNGTLKFLGVWRDKPGPKRGAASGSGALFAGITWEQLVAHRKELGEHQYLSEVETYVSNGKRLFVGVWRVGQGNGALYLMNDWEEFNKLKRSLNATQEMLDFEMFQNSDGEWNFLGVWRVSGKQAGPLHVSSVSNTFRPLTADQFVDKWQDLKATHTLVDISIANPSVILRGNLKCKYGDGDCNRCANDVPTQFKLAFEKGHRPWIVFKGASWSFSGDRRYPPDNVKPEDAFIPLNASKHIQGLVRTNSSTYPYAGSHSHTSRGSIFFIANKDGKNKLYSMHNSTRDHPGGVHVLGDGLFVPEGDSLRWFAVDAVDRGGFNQNNSFKIPKDDKDPKGLQGGGGGLGLAKLADGTYLLVVTAPGDGFRPKLGIGSLGAADENRRARFTRFYRITGSDAGHPDKPVEFLGQYEHGYLSKYPETPMAYSENLSLVTECGTGHLYTIHTTGEYKLNGDGYWRLSRVESGLDEGEPRLKHISIARQSQDTGDCHHRSSATVRVNKSGQLEFLCSERKVTKVNHGTFNFKEGKP